MRIGPLTDALRREFRGRLILPGSAEFEQARRVANGRVDKSPAVIARCEGTDDVVAAVRYAREAELPLAVRSGGHHVAGWGTIDGGLLIDLSAMKRARVDPAARTVTAEPGLTTAEYDRRTQRFGLASPSAHLGGVGIAGFTLGGGIGELTRQYGLACDNLVAAEVVTAEGEVLTASRTERPDLLWGLRGAGANFGVVTALTNRLHPVDRLVGGPLVHAAEAAAGFLRAVADWLARAPDTAAMSVVLWTTPPLPFLPEAVHGVPSVLALPTWFGAPAAADAALAEVRRFGAPLSDRVGPMSYLEYQGLITEPPHVRQLHQYTRIELMPELDPGVIDKLVEEWLSSPAGVTVVLNGLGGAFGRVDGSDTAFGHRAARWMVEVDARWRPDEDPARYLHAAWRLISPLSPTSLGPYANQLVERAPELVRASYGHANHDRLVALKTRYDPDNVFRHNVNIRPS
ncbi:FAD-binding oxidoreductase [Pseudonocardia acaciae]|uniref:FAD-binding oxidoreductase n=1 Tax=Pseudonocardia acaciae TaxID=551276 RepID=UPI0006889EA0|nr:FAD-dependent oxidoreductase [Pseudonocardia acaciae]